MPPVVEARALSRRFGRRWAVARLDLALEPGERLLLLGANGSGKTTLLRLLSTLLGPSSGSLRIFGEDAWSRRAELRPRIGLLSHQPGLYEDLSGIDNLRVVARLLGREVPPELLARVGLEARPDPVRHWSSGMRKRLSLALLLLKEPALALVDEPFAALDPLGMDAVEALMRGLPGTVVVASHRVQRASAFCDRALLLDQGLPRWLGPAAQAWEAWRALHGAGDGAAEPASA
jgi:heme exporter protein A